MTWPPLRPEAPQPIVLASSRRVEMPRSASVSAFIARFHGVFGCTPGRYAAGEPIHASLVTPSGMVGTTVDTADQ
ncbi:hypothetical protein AAGT95_00065 [Salinicola lusitanus]|uniref:AraC family transcriptional regulator n=1 Tax=Salinicola lusitanus TaxID=1949085 RepID=A0ABZ3CT79_9GAMM